MDESRREFIRLITRHERLVYGYILSLVPSWADADEILQETNVRLWDEFDKFTPGTNFAGWALRVAHFQVLTWRNSADRTRLVFNQKIVDSLADHRSQLVEGYDARYDALNECLQRLSDRNRSLLGECYARDTKIKEVASRLKRTPDAVYKALERLRRSLHDCIKRKLSEEAM